MFQGYLKVENGSVYVGRLAHFLSFSGSVMVGLVALARRGTQVTLDEEKKISENGKTRAHSACMEYLLFS